MKTTKYILSALKYGAINSICSSLTGHLGARIVNHLEEANNAIPNATQAYAMGGAVSGIVLSLMKNMLKDLSNQSFLSTSLITGIAALSLPLNGILGKMLLNDMANMSIKDFEIGIMGEMAFLGSATSVALAVLLISAGYMTYSKKDAHAEIEMDEEEESDLENTLEYSDDEAPLLRSVHP